MWELICDHNYCWGKIAADRSPWRPASDGRAYGVHVVPDHTGLRFSGPQSRISIASKAPWLSLTGIRIEMTLRLPGYQGQPHLIAGDGSFGMYMGPDGSLFGYCRGDPATMYLAPQSNTPMAAVSTSFDAVHSLFRPVPVGRWVRLTFVHDGFNRMHLFIDDTLVATTKTLYLVPGVGPNGISIGNALVTNDAYLTGDIDTVRVWRTDPRAKKRAFFARPLDPALSGCWTEFLRALGDALRRHPDCAQWLANALADLERNFRHSLAQKSDAKIEEFWAMCREYQVLWRAGALDTAEMQALATRLRRWLTQEGLLGPNDTELNKVIGHRCMELLLKRLPQMDCDPGAIAVIRALLGTHRDTLQHWRSA